MGGHAVVLAALLDQVCSENIWSRRPLPSSAQIAIRVLAIFEEMPGWSRLESDS